MAQSSNNQVIRNSLSHHDKFHSRSKAQMCLKKIIDIIVSSSSSLQPCDEIFKTSLTNNPKSKELVNSTSDDHDLKTRDLFSGKRVLDIDLNLRLGLSPLETKSEVNKGLSACSGVGKVCGIVVADCNSSAISGGFSAVDKSSEGECDPNKEVVNSIDEVNRREEKGKEVIEEEETREFSEITNLPIQSFETETTKPVPEEEVVVEEVEQKDEQEEDEEEKFLRKTEHKNEGYLGLLVEAARLISGNFEEEDEEMEMNGKSLEIENDERNESIRRGSKRNHHECWMFDLCEGFDDISPVVRSKRGRNQVLPYRYRDSVLDPWKRISRQQRSSRDSTKNRK